MELEFNEIKEIITLVQESDFTKFSIKVDNVEINMSRQRTKKEMPLSEYTVQDIPSVVTPSGVIEKPNIPAKTYSHCVKSPLVGTFYPSSSPGKESFVKIGDIVKKGETLCIIEAMKVMNEIASDADGMITEIFAQSEQLVQYGQELFGIKES